MVYRDVFKYLIEVEIKCFVRNNITIFLIKYSKISFVFITYRPTSESKMINFSIQSDLRPERTIYKSKG